MAGSRLENNFTKEVCRDVQSGRLYNSAMRKKWIIASAVILGCLLVIIFLPLPKALTSVGPTTIAITDRYGELLYDVRKGGLQGGLPYEKIPRQFIDALVATEDRTFFSHPGLSLRGIVRAAIHDLKAMRIVEGGSTITQQLVRTKLQPASRGLLYKIREAWLAIKLDAVRSKEKILQDFLSSVYFGHQAYGISAAADTYFSKSVEQLSLSETALLVGLINAPTNLNPFKNIKGAQARRDVVLSAMRRNGMITEKERQDARTEPLSLSHGKALIQAPHFVLWVQSERPEAFKGPGSVVTTLDLDLQRQAEEAVAQQLEHLKDKNVTSAAVVVLDAKNGDILAMVGSADFFNDEDDGQVNVAVSHRQPGSALKPFTYALAFEQGMTPASTVADIETQFFTQEGNPYIPRNYDYGYHGLVRLRQALANSYNIAAVKVLERIGTSNLLAFLKRTGITTLTESPEHYGLALTLGDGEVTLLELTAAYGMFARGGRTLMPRSLVSDPPGESSEVMDPRVAWLISDILSDDAARLEEFGGDGPLSFDFPVAAKTGTTRNSRDNWTIGYTPNRMVGVWVGNADNSPMRGTSGVTGAGPIFHDVMIAAAHGSADPFVQPQGIVDAEVCALSGKLPTPLCPSLVTEHFLNGTVPTERDDVYREFSIDRRNDLLAGPGCDPQFVDTKVFAVFPPELRKWARENGWKSPPTSFSPACPEARSSSSVSTDSLVITKPAEHASFLLDPLIPDDQENVVLEARASDAIESIVWYVDGVRIGEGRAPDFRLKWKPTRGNHRIEARTSTQTAVVAIEVVRE